MARRQMRAKSPRCAAGRKKAVIILAFVQVSVPAMVTARRVRDLTVICIGRESADRPRQFVVAR